MPPASPFPSISAVGDRLGGLIEAQLETAFRRLIHGPGVTQEARFARLVTGAPHPLANFAVIHSLTDLESTKLATQPLIECGAPSAVLYPGMSIGEDVAAYLHETGFHPHETMVAMAVEIDKLAPTALPDGYEFVRVAEGPTGDAWTAALAAGFEFPMETAQAFAPTASVTDLSPDAEVQYFAIVKEGRSVCTSLLFLSGGFAGIYCVSTIPEARGKGLGAHATAQPLRLARERDYRVGILQGTEIGCPVYRRLGFTNFGGVPVYVRTPAA